MANRMKESLALVAAASMAMAVQAQPSFTPLGFLSATSQYSGAMSVSADGRVVAGYSTRANILDNEAFVWTREAGMVPLGRPPASQPDSRGLGISGDGSTIVGMAFHGGEFDSRAVVWRDGVGPTQLTGNPLGSAAYAASFDGSVIAGRQGSNMAAIWTGESIVTELGHLPGHNRSAARHVSADGRVAVGFSRSSTGQQAAFRWTEANGMQQLGTYDDEFQIVEAFTSNPDGSVIAGAALRPTGGGRAAVWNEIEGTTLLPSLPTGFGVSQAWAMSADAGTFGGWALGPGSLTYAVIWTQEHGGESFQDFLSLRCGVDLTGWRLTEIRGISADGKTIVGTGVHDGVTEAFVAVIPAPGVVAPLAILAWRRRRR